MNLSNESGGCLKTSTRSILLVSLCTFKFALKNNSQEESLCLNTPIIPRFPNNWFYSSYILYIIIRKIFTKKHTKTHSLIHNAFIKQKLLPNHYRTVRRRRRNQASIGQLDDRINETRVTPQRAYT